MFMSFFLGNSSDTSLKMTFFLSQSQLPGIGVELPAAIFGVLALIAGIMMYWIPETLFAPMYQTVEEAEAAEDDFSIPCFKKHSKNNNQQGFVGENDEKNP